MVLAGRGATRPSPLAREDRDDGWDDDWDDAAWIARRMALDASAEAARLRRQASAQAAAIREATERETETIRRQASARAATIREAAERETAELRSAVMKLSAATGELAVIDGDVPGQEAAGLAGKAGTRTAVKRRPPRQLVAVRVAAAATAALFLFALAAGTTEVALHGFAFFVFRSAGTGETSSKGLQEDQGPGQPDAPKPTPSPTRSHIKTARLARHGHRGKRPGARSKEGGTQGG